MATYLVIDANNVIQNIVDWDGTTPFQPDGDTLVAYNGAAAVGWTWNGTTATNPNPAPVQAVVPPLPPQAADDSHAASAGVPVGGIYCNGSQMMMRQS
jgi:hypothetical protein